MRTVKEMVDHFGSQKYVAERLGVTNQTVSNWVTSNYISRSYRLPFYQLLKEFKYPNPSLVELNELKKSNTTTENINPSMLLEGLLPVFLFF